MLCISATRLKSLQPGGTLPGWWRGHYRLPTVLDSGCWFPVVFTSILICTSFFNYGCQILAYHCGKCFLTWHCWLHRTSKLFVEHDTWSPGFPSHTLSIPCRFQAIKSLYTQVASTPSYTIKIVPKDFPQLRQVLLVNIHMRLDLDSKELYFYFSKSHVHWIRFINRKH